MFEFLAWKRSAPVYLNAVGRPLSLLRYAMWGHATPIMLYALSMISDFSAAELWTTMGVDVIMIVTVIPGELIRGAYLTKRSTPCVCVCVGAVLCVRMAAWVRDVPWVRLRRYRGAAAAAAARGCGCCG